MPTTARQRSSPVAASSAMRGGKAFRALPLGDSGSNCQIRPSASEMVHHGGGRGRFAAARTSGTRGAELGLPLEPVAIAGRSSRRWRVTIESPSARTRPRHGRTRSWRLPLLTARAPSAVGALAGRNDGADAASVPRAKASSARRAFRTVWSAKAMAASRLL